MNDQSRREFIGFLGRTALTAWALPELIGCASAGSGNPSLPFQPISPTSADDLVLANGFKYDLLIKWKDPLSGGRAFGTNNDYTAFFPMSPKAADEGILWVNHEAVDTIFVSGWTKKSRRTLSQVKAEMREVGGSLVHIRKIKEKWQVVKGSRFNRRIDAQTKIPFASERPISGKKFAMGTLGNCAGGVTPWGTVLTCEENYDHFFGEYRYNDQGKPEWFTNPEDIGWREFFPYSPEHYGWVVEVNPRTGSAKKLTALGRFRHECATTTLARDGRVVVYSGEDAANEFLYKFISKRPGSLEEGELFVANTHDGKWLSLSYAKSPELQKKFRDQTEVLIRAREAARLLGATPLDRPEDIEVDPKTGAVLVTLTNNIPKGNFHGTIFRLAEENNDPLALKFSSSTFMVGGEKNGFSCPDNMVFDRKGNLWLCCDVSDRFLNKPPYVAYGNNALFYIPMSGPHSGRAYRVASAPVTAEITGPTFSPDGRTLFLSVQHPGEGTSDLKNPLSHWPGPKGSMPKSSVVCLSGPALDALVL